MVFRFIKIMWVLLWGWRCNKLPQSFISLGPVFVKLGQSLSMRPDIVGDKMADDLAYLQDDIPAFSSKLVHQTIMQEFGKSADKLFTEFDDEPVAAASIAQVHFAKDTEGNHVAVKILRPNIEKEFSRDIKLLYKIAALINFFVPKYRRLKLREVIDVFAQSTNIELDLRLEAAAASELKDNFKGDENFIVPAVNWNLTTQRIFTMERIYGCKIDDLKSLKNFGLEPESILKKASAIFFQQIYRDGFFHADMHAGNCFVSKEGKIIAVDFGIMGRIDLQTRIFLAEMLIGFMQRDYYKVAQVHFDAGYIPKNQDIGLFSQACRAIGEPIFGKKQSEISLAKLLMQLFKITQDFNMETQPQLILLQKTMVIAEGLATKLCPDINFWQESQPFIEQWCKDNLGAMGSTKRAINALGNPMITMLELAKIVKILPEIITEDGIKLSR